MANYLPVLLVSVNAGMPDDAAVQPLPRGQVDYLSHDWAEEDVWRSWRNMTKQKNEIANGVRLENASWRTWWKQRNKLKTVSPETLNWLKDSDVTWLYGPLHTAIDWMPPLKASPSQSHELLSADHQQQQSITEGPSKGNSRMAKGANSISSPSSSVALNQYHPPALRYGTHDQHSQQGTMKPILKHRSIAEMLSSALPATPLWNDDNDIATEDDGDGDDLSVGSDSGKLPHERRATFSGKSGRPPMFHTKSDTHLLPRFGRGKGSKVSPPRVAPAAADREPEGFLSASQRTGASNNLADLAFGTTAPSAQSQSQGPTSSYWGAVSSATMPPPMESAESSASEAASSGWSDGDAGSLSPAMVQVPQKKHISFNAIVEQCIAIDGGSTPLSPSTRQGPWVRYDDGYAEDNEDGLYEDVGMHDDSDSDDQRIDEEDEVLEIKPPSRRGSSSSLQDTHPTMANADARQLYSRHNSAYPERPPFRRSSTSKSSRSRASGSSSGGNSASTSRTSRTRLSLGPSSDREHVSIAPIAPTILKAGGVEKNDDGVLYIGNSYSMYGHGSGNYPYNGSYNNSSYASNSNGGVYGTGFGYGYGGYGYGERVSAGRSDAYEHFERGTEGGGLVYQSPNGNVYPWGERDAVRFRMQAEFGMPGATGSPPRFGQDLAVQQRTGSSTSLSSNGRTHFVPGPVVGTPSPEMDTEEAEFEYFDRAEPEQDQGPEDEQMIVDGERAQSGFDADETLHEGLVKKEGVQIVVPYSNGGGDSVERRDTRGRTPSPDFQPKMNPRIASLKSESGVRSPPMSSSNSMPPADGTSTIGISSTPANAIPTPGISSAHEQEFVQMRSPPESPTIQAGLLSPPDVSPGRGRSICTSPVSGYMTSGSATSSSGLTSGDSRSVSESRSDSRGRSRTRNSSVSASDQEVDRGRSRSRSTASGANSPLSDSSSPHARCPPMAIAIGGGIGGQHSGREVRDGRGARLYRKTSEDFIDGSHTVGSSSPRGRNRDGRRVSESLSPPVLGSASTDMVTRRSAVSPPNAGTSYRPIPSSGLGYQPYSVSTFGQNSVPSLNSIPNPNHYGISDKHQLPDGVPVVKLPTSSGLAPVLTRRGSQELSDGASSGGSSTASAGGRTLPPCIPEEDEQRPRPAASIPTASSLPPVIHPDSQTKSVPSSPSLGAHTPRVKTRNVSPSKPSSSVSEIRASKISGSSSTSPPPLAARSKANELVSSARTLLGTIWNGSTA
ncbi:hypothetical protein M0805_008103 [Coniferiporia weirii]|nr:hypothetical protein M0805_008103 [Coniferiporia weirii]